MVGSFFMSCICINARITINREKITINMIWKWFRRKSWTLEWPNINFGVKRLFIKYDLKTPSGNKARSPLRDFGRDSLRWMPLLKVISYATLNNSPYECTSIPDMCTVCKITFIWTSLVPLIVCHISRFCWRPVNILLNNISVPVTVLNVKIKRKNSYSKQST